MVFANKSVISKTTLYIKCNESANTCKTSAEKVHTKCSKSAASASATHPYAPICIHMPPLHSRVVTSWKVNRCTNHNLLIAFWSDRVVQIQPTWQLALRYFKCVFTSGLKCQFCYNLAIGCPQRVLGWEGVIKSGWGFTSGRGGRIEDKAPTFWTKPKLNWIGQSPNIPNKDPTKAY